MLKRLTAALICLCRPDVAARVLGSQALARVPAVEDLSPEAFVPETLTPVQCRVIFAFTQTLLTSWAVKLYPNYDLTYVEGADPEIYWKMIYFGVQVEKIKRPARAEWFMWFLTDYSKAVSDVAIVSQNVRPGA